jgi:hypothetical protein
MPITNELLAQARAIVIRTRNPGVAALQAQLRIGYSSACELIIRLQHEGILLLPFPGRATGIHPDWRRIYVQSIKGDVRLAHFERVVQLALFYFELAEEDSDAHSEIARPQVAWTGIRWKDVQHQFRSNWYGQQNLSLTEAALAFNAWLGIQGIAEALLEEAAITIRAGCLPYERPYRPVRDERERLDRLYVRMARFFRRGVREDFSHHSRVAEYFVGNDLAPHSEWVLGYHGEHVVPCAVLRDIAFDLYADRWSVMHVAALMKRLLVVAYIPQEGKLLLDSGRRCLRNRMPDSAWDPMEGCIYARLHAKNIDVPFIAEYPCTCVH